MTPEELVKEYTDKSKPFPLPSLEGMYVHPRYVIHQHDLQELIDALRTVIRGRDEARAELAENEAVIAVWRGRTERAEKERDEARAKLAQFDEKYNIEALQAALDAEAQRGYRRGVQDAAKAIGKELKNPFGLINGDKMSRAILALLEKENAEPSLSPEDKLG